jgi:hypothetical protein
VELWRKACDSLAGPFDAVVRNHVNGLTGRAIWS